MISLRELQQNLEEALEPVYGKQEAQSMATLVLEHQLNVSRLTLHTNPTEKVTDDKVRAIEQIKMRLLKQEPLQYILGEAFFYGEVLRVTPNVLIPRPETEELVDWILQESYRDILDIGTGSGCIAIMLAKYQENAKVCAFDISEKALEVAEENAKKLQVQVDFQRQDILKWETQNFPQFDCIVSNPPYVREYEKARMQPNVLEHEPDTALFVPDNNPLLFYQTIADFGQQQLTVGGKLYFEINEALGAETCQLLKERGYQEVVLRKDLSGKDRMISARK